MMLCSHCLQSARPDVLHLSASSIAWSEPIEITQQPHYGAFASPWEQFIHTK